MEVQIRTRAMHEHAEPIRIVQTTTRKKKTNPVQLVSDHHTNL